MVVTVVWTVRRAQLTNSGSWNCEPRCQLASTANEKRANAISFQLTEQVEERLREMGDEAAMPSLESTRDMTMRNQERRSEEENLKTRKIKRQARI